MLTNAEILELIKNGEDSTVEFKLEGVNAESLAQEIVAFANIEGGTILFGVDDSGDIVGITRHDLEEWIINICRQSIEPPIIPVIKRAVIDDKRILAVIIPKSYSVVSTKRGQYFIRVGSTKQQPTTAELARLFQQRRLVAADEAPVPASDIDDLDLPAINRYFLRLAQSELTVDNSQLLLRELINTGIMVEIADGVLPTLAGILAFGKLPQRFFPSYEIRASAFAASSFDSDVVDQKDIQGQLPDMINGAISFVSRNIKNSSTIPDGVRRVDRLEYPIEAVREAVINAIAHRDYLISGAAIRLFIFDDRIELYSPGGLPNTLTLETMKYKQFSRNQTLVSFLTGLGFMERRGKGILRMINLMREYNLPPPRFELIEEELLVTFIGKAQSPKSQVT
ncbi:MAG: RNA-binding domain-containing protein [Candidatus Poribacteria bacterium]